MMVDPLDRFTMLVIGSVVIFSYFFFYTEFHKFLSDCYKHTRCRLGYHNAKKSKYYCPYCKLPSKKYLKVIDGGDKSKKVNANDFKF